MRGYPMRCKRAFLLVLLCALMGVPALAEGVAWKEGYGELLDAAETEQKPFMIDFYTSWCTFCKALDKESFEDPAISAMINENMVAAQLDGDVQKAATARFSPEGYPTVIFATPDGDEILRFAGYRTRDQVYEIVKKVLEVGPRVAELHRKIDEDKRSFEAHEELGRLYVELGVGALAERPLSRAKRYAPDDAAERRVLFLTARAEYLDGRYRAACKTLDKLIEESGDAAETRAYMELLAESYEAWEKPAQAEKIRSELTSRFGG